MYGNYVLFDDVKLFLFTLIFYKHSACAVTMHSYIT